MENFIHFFECFIIKKYFILIVYLGNLYYVTYFNAIVLLLLLCIITIYQFLGLRDNYFITPYFFRHSADISSYRPIVCEIC